MQDEEERMGTRATQQRGEAREGHSAGMTGRQDRPLTESRSQLRGVGDAISSLLRPLGVCAAGRLRHETGRQPTP